ncbi:MAG: cell division protein FtsA [Candidatus Acetothermia bacterium]
MGQKAAGLDFGTTKIAALIGDVDEESNSNTKIVGVGKAPPEGLDGSRLSNPRKAASEVRKALGQAQEMASTEIDFLYAGIGPSQLTRREASGTVSIRRRKSIIDQEDVERCLEVAKPDRLPRGQRVIEITPLQFSVDGQQGITNPVGMKGRRLDVKLSIFACPENVARNLISCIKSAELQLSRLVPKPVASAEAVLTPMEKKQGVIMMDIGGGNTDVAVFQRNHIRTVYSVPLGGKHITNDLSACLNTTLENAERIKLSEPLLKDQPQGKFLLPEEIEVQDTSENRIKIARSQLKDITAARLEEIFEMSFQAVRESGLKNPTSLRLVLTGGGSLLEDLPAFVENEYGLQVRIASGSANVEGLTDVVQNPIYTTAIGLINYGIKRRRKLPSPFSHPLNQAVSNVERWLKDLFG